MFTKKKTETILGKIKILVRIFTSEMTLAPCGGGCAKNPDKEQPEQPMAAHPLCTLGAEGELPKTVVQSLLCGPRVVVKAT